MFAGCRHYNQNIGWYVRDNANIEHIYDGTPLEYTDVLRAAYSSDDNSEDSRHPQNDEDTNPSEDINPSEESISSKENHNIDTTSVDAEISVFNPLIPGEELASTFFEEQEDYNPFIIKGPDGKYSGEAIDWPAPSSSGKDFVECIDEAPSYLQGSYRKWLKPNGRVFIKLTIGGSIYMVEKPDWYSSARGVPGTRYFKLIELPNKVFKFMSKVLSSGNLPPGWNAMGADHCNQTGPLGTYRLVEMTLDELRADVASGRGKKRKAITNKTKAIKKKTTKKAKNKSKTIKKRDIKKPTKHRKKPKAIKLKATKKNYNKK
jgi:hypothetical protein